MTVPSPHRADHVTIARIAEIGAMVGDSGRTNMLFSLLEEGPRTAGELADRAGVTPQTASNHIGKLINAGMVRVERRGRHRVHHLLPAVADLLRVMRATGRRLQVHSDATTATPESGAAL